MKQNLFARGFGDGSGGAETFNSWDDPDLSARAAYYISTDYLIGFVVAAFDEYIGLDLSDQIEWSILIKDDHGIYETNRSQYRSS
jgi:hypothetical protein